jgi:hypothetical protein
VGGHQLEQRGTSLLYQYGVGDLLSVAVPRHGYRGRPMIGCTLVDPLRTKAVRRHGVAHMFWVSLVDKFQSLIVLYFEM